MTLQDLACRQHISYADDHSSIRWISGYIALYQEIQ